MSYDYLFKYIIIGDTGSILFYLSFCTPHASIFCGEHHARSPNHRIVQEWASRAFCCSSPTSGFSRFTTSPSALSSWRAWSPLTAAQSSSRSGTRRETFNHLANWLEDARQHANPNMSIMLIGNKCDLAHRRAISKEEGEQFAREHGLLFLEASAKTPQNVEEAFINTAAKIHQKILDGAFDISQEISGIKVGYGRSQGAAGGREGTVAQGGGCCSCDVILPFSTGSSCFSFYYV